ncbi:element excision factor XisI family protein [Herpetosiphon llansteffanensis]
MVAFSPTTLIETVLMAMPCPDTMGACTVQTVFDRQQHQYMLVIAGWHGQHRIHQCLVHIAYYDERVWIHCDHTIHGIPERLIAAGIPATRILQVFPLADLRRP